LKEDTDGWQVKAGFVSKREIRDLGRKPDRQTTGSSAPTGNPEGATHREASSAPGAVLGAASSLQRPREERINQQESEKRIRNTLIPEEPTDVHNDADQNGQEPTIGAYDESKGKHIPVVITRSGRESKPVQHLMIEAMMTELSATATSNDVEGEIFSFQALYPDGDEQLEMDKNPLLAYKAHADPDTMYLHEALRENDKEQFIQAMKKEVEDQIANKNFTIIRKGQVPKGEHILPMVWQMRRKRDIKTRQIKKHKARLNVDGSKMIKGLHYDESYSPVASWSSVRAMLTMVAVNN
jgi:hypothetical protein